MGTKYAVYVIEWTPPQKKRCLEDGERSTPSWWKSRWYHDPEIEGEVTGAIRAKDKAEYRAVYRVFLSLFAVSCSSLLAG